MRDMVKSGVHAEKVTPRALAFYLPQYHPIPENDQWWGKGFTEWANVSRARPSFPGHYQPHVPGELGYYDLRVPEVRQAQADLAAEYGISGFVYYHYWFNGKRLLERPFEEVLASGSPDFPFALCWANEEWTRNWDAQTGKVLIPQEYSDQDDLAHIQYLITAFSDDRYIKIHGRPMLLVYRPTLLPNPKRTFETWRKEVQKAGFPDLYLCYVESWGPPKGGPEAFGMDASVGFMPNTGDHLFTPVGGLHKHRVLDYQTSVDRQMRRPPPDWKRLPSVMVGWDNSARRQLGATIFEGATPEAYERWLRQTVESIAHVPKEENFLFILAWNEWAEGNHLEPDQRFGRAFLEATRAVMIDSANKGQGVPSTVTTFMSGPPLELTSAADLVAGASSRQKGLVANAAGLVDQLMLDRTSTSVELGAGSSVTAELLRTSGIASCNLAIDPAAVTLPGQSVSGSILWNPDNPDSQLATLNDVEKVGAMIALDLVENLPEPQDLLATLSEWSLKHGEPLLVISVPNVSHFDVGLRLLCGQWSPQASGSLQDTDLRFFTRTYLERLVERCGWQIVAQDDLCAVRSAQHDTNIDDLLPVEMVGALRVLAEAQNVDAYVERFVWALRPVPITDPPSSFLDAIGYSRVERTTMSDENVRVVNDYLVSVGLIASETNRRAAKSRRLAAELRRWGNPDDPLPTWKRKLLGTVKFSPRASAAFQRAHRRLR
jgi:hypothetical protein